MVDVATPARLRALILAARQDPLILTYSYRSLREWDGSDAPQTCPHGHELMPGRAGGRDCLCGLGHFVIECWKRAVQHLPPLGPGCGEVPSDPEAGKHRW